MAIPKFFECFEVFLKTVNDGELHTAKDVRAIIAQKMQLSDEDLSELLPSGKQRTFDNRVAWARTYLDKAGLVDTPQRGKYRITKAGQEALRSGEKIDLSYLEKSNEFKEFHSATAPVEITVPEEEQSGSPLETLESAYEKVTAALASQLMDEIMKLTPTEFERLVVKLLLKMGYGNGIDEAGMVTPRSNDGGIDGIIKEDQLGFSSIFIQAKQWAVDQTVSRPELHKFVGALMAQQAQKGLFITTANFSSGARQYVANLSGLKIVLVDGQALTKLMIKHNVGVSVESIYEVKKIDSDFFADEL